MTVTRTPDPLGLLPDHIRIDPGTGTESEDITASMDLLNRNTLSSRISRLRRHDQLNTYADELHALALQKGLGIRDIEEDWEMRARVAESELAALYFDAEYLPARVRKAVSANAVQRKIANDPKQITRRAARALWPEANRKGWTAVKFHAELRRRGHDVAPDTARKWLTALRKTGAC